MGLGTLGAGRGARLNYPTEILLREVFHASAGVDTQTSKRPGRPQSHDGRLQKAVVGTDSRALAKTR